MSTFDIMTTAMEQRFLEQEAALELNKLGRIHEHRLHPLPPACHELIRSIPGNDKCVDCGAHNPEWATISYGALICMRCASRHRSLGVKYSKVRSLSMDDWAVDQVLKMLEGGNEQLNGFFHRHRLSTFGEQAIENLNKRYRTKAAKFYLIGLDQHVNKVALNGFKGRNTSRCQSNL